MYTELVISARVKNDPVVVSILRAMVDSKGPLITGVELPSHPFFKTERWSYMFHSASHYFVPRAVSVFKFTDIGEYWAFIVRCDLKNYDQEIELFLDWMTPYWDRPDTMLGYSRYEQSREPTIHYSSKPNEDKNE